MPLPLMKPHKLTTIRLMEKDLENKILRHISEAFVKILCACLGLQDFVLNLVWSGKSTKAQKF